MLDLLIKNSNLPDGRVGVDIAADNGRIVEVGPRLEVQADREIDATGRLVSRHLSTAIFTWIPP